MNKFLLTFLLLTIGQMHSLFAQIQQLDSSELKVFWRIPLMSKFEARSTWIEIQRTNGELVRRLPFHKLVTHGEFKLERYLEGRVRLLYQDPVSRELILLATQSLQDKWFPPVEICSDERELTGCEVELFLDTQLNRLLLEFTYVQ